MTPPRPYHTRSPHQTSGSSRYGRACFTHTDNTEPLNQCIFPLPSPSTLIPHEADRDGRVIPLAHAAQQLSPEQWRFSLVDMGGLPVRPTAPAIMDGSRIYTRNRVRQEHWDQPGRRQGRSRTADISRTLPRQRFPRIEMQLGSFFLYCCFAVTAIESDFLLSDYATHQQSIAIYWCFPPLLFLNL